MRSRKQILQNLNQFFDKIKNKRKRNMQLQVNNEFQQVQIKDLNDKYNVKMFSTAVKEEKHLQLNKKLENLKAGKLSVLKTKVPPTTIILQLMENINNVKSKKYGTPSDVQQKSLLSEKFKTFNFHRIEQ